MSAILFVNQRFELSWLIKGCDSRELIRSHISFREKIIVSIRIQDFGIA